MAKTHTYSIYAYKIRFLPKSLLIIFLCPVKECNTIEVITTSGSANGIYEVSEERSPNSPANPVWSKPGVNYYFFNPGTNLPWMIGSYDDLTTKESQSNYYQGTILSIISYI